jgi:hypothetical protein
LRVAFLELSAIQKHEELSRSVVRTKEVLEAVLMNAIADFFFFREEATFIL